MVLTHASPLLARMASSRLGTAQTIECRQARELSSLPQDQQDVVQARGSTQTCNHVCIIPHRESLARELPQYQTSQLREGRESSLRRKRIDLVWTIEGSATLAIAATAVIQGRGSLKLTTTRRSCRGYLQRGPSLRTIAATQYSTVSMRAQNPLEMLRMNLMRLRQE